MIGDDDEDAAQLESRNENKGKGVKEPVRARFQAMGVGAD